MATIGGSMSNSLFSGTEFNDTIFNGDEHYTGGSNNTIIGNAGNDSIYNNGSFVTISGDDGNDFIRNRYKKTTAAVYGNNVSMSGGNGNDSICNGGIWESFIGAYITGGSNVTINGGEGDDTIYHSNGENLLIEYKTGDGDDVITGFNETSTLSISGDYSTAVSGNDVIVTVGDGSITLSGAASLSTVNISGTEVVTAKVIRTSVNNTLITGTALNDTIHTYGNGVTVQALGGIDSVGNYGDSVSVSGGDGNDHLDNRGNIVTLTGGAGNDILWNDTYRGGANKVKLDGEGGDDTLASFGDDSTLLGGTGNDSIANYKHGSSGHGSNASIDGGLGNDRIINWGNDATISAGDGDDSIGNYFNAKLNGEIIFEDGGQRAKIDAGTGNDTVTNNAASVSIDGGAGDDLIQSWSSEKWNEETQHYDIVPTSDNSTLSGGTGDDSIFNEGNNVSISGGASNDFLVNGQYYEYERGGDNVTMRGDTGNDTLTNNGTKALLDGGAGNDLIYNGYRYSASVKGFYYTDDETYTGNNSTVSGGEGDDTINNNGSNVSISGGTGDDSINNNGAGSVTVKGGAGNDTILGNGKATAGTAYQYADGDGNDLIDGFKSIDLLVIGNGTTATYSKATKGEDVIISVGEGSITLQGAASLSTINILGSLVGGSEVIGNSTSNTAVNGTSGDDSISNSGNYVTISALGGDDTINNYGTAPSVTSYSAGKYALILAGDGNDFVDNSGSNGVIDGGDGSDTIRNDSYALNATITGGAGNDSIYNSANAIIYGGDGADTINNTNLGAKATIAGNAGNDYITTYNADNVSIAGGTGNDKIELRGSASGVTVSGDAGNDTVSIAGGSNLVKYTDGDGNDLITGFNVASTLSISGAPYSTAVSGNNLIVTVGDGSITLQGAASLTALNILGTEINPLDIVGTGGADSIVNSLAGATIQALGGNDKISNSGSKAIIDAGTGNDSIKNTAAQVSIVGGTGKDSVTNTKTKVTIDTGTGNDRIVNSAASVSIFGGTGNDLVSIGANAKNNVITYTAGNDMIKGFNATSTLKLGDGSAEYSKETIGNDVILTVGDYVLTLTGAASLTTLNILGTEENRTGVEIDGKTARLTDDFTEDSFSIVDNLDVTTIDAFAVTYDIELVGNKKANSILGGAGNDILEGGKGNDTLTGGAGSDIFLYNSGDGNDVITDYTEEDVLQIASGTIVTSTSGDDIIFKIGTGKITVKGGLTQKTVTYYDANGNENFIVNKTVDFNEGTGATLLGNYAKSTFDENDYAQYVNTLQTIDATAVTHDLAITGNKNANTIIGGTGNDTINGAAGSDNLTGGAGSDVFVYTAGNDLITDYDEEDRIRIDGTVSKVTTSKQHVIFTVAGKGKISVKGGADKVITYEETSEQIRFYPVNINAAGTGATLLAGYAKDSFDVADYGDYEGTLKTVDASKVSRDLTITANTLANKILGGTGNDTLYGGKGNDSLNGGKGSDVFVYNNGDGNDTIVGYTEGEDRIQIALKDISSVIGSASVKGSNVTFTVGKGKIVVKGGTEQLITFVDANGKEHFYPDEVSFSDDGKQATILADYNKSAFNISDYGSYGTTVQTINGAAVTHDLSITGNSKANEISGSTNNDFLDGAAGKDILYGGEGNDTLQGGTGNDTLWGEDGADVFLYKAGDGNDIIEDYAKGEKISITGAAVDKATVRGNNVVLTIGSNKITVRDAAKTSTPVTYCDDNGEHICGASNDLLADDNYSADAAQLSQIVEFVNADYVPYDFDSGLTLSLVPCPLSLNPNCFFSKT